MRRTDITGPGPGCAPAPRSPKPAAAATGWARRLAGHPVIAAALAAGQLVPVSLARLICDWTDKLPDDLREDADGVLLAAVLGGADRA